MSEQPIYPSSCQNIPGWFTPPHGLQEIIRCYGQIEVSDGQVTTPGWESANMEMFHEPWMPSGKLYVNKKVWPILKATIESCLAIGDGYPIRTLGCFSPRAKRVNGDLSTHSWAIAIDLNAAENTLQEVGGPVICDIPDTWIAMFETSGWTWGGRFSGRKDPMHCQFASGF